MWGGKTSVCLPPKQPPVQTPRYLVPAGTACRITRIERLAWRDYLTTKDVGFERFERYLSGGYWEFRHEGWLMQVRVELVKYRDDRPMARPGRERPRALPGRRTVDEAVALDDF